MLEHSFSRGIAQQMRLPSIAGYCGSLVIGIIVGAVTFSDDGKDAHRPSIGTRQIEVPPIRGTSGSSSSPSFMTEPRALLQGKPSLLSEGISTVVSLMPRSTIEYAARQFSGTPQNQPLPIKDVAAYVSTLATIATDNGLGDDARRSFQGTIHFGDKEPKEIVSQGRVPYEGNPARLAPPFGSATSPAQPESSPVTFGTDSKRIYASFNTAAEENILTKWTGPNGEILEFRLYPLAKENTANYVWLERSNWVPGRYTVQYYSPLSLELKGAGEFEVK